MLDRESGGGLAGMGCVGQDASPGTSLCGMGRSSTGNTGTPFLRSRMKTRPIFVTSTRAGFVSATLDCNQRGRSGWIVVPDIVVDQLEVPQKSAGPGVQRDYRIAIQIFTFAIAAVEVVSRRADREEHCTGLSVYRKPRPHIRAGAVLPRVAFPGIVPRLTGTRHGVKRPDEFSCSNVPSAHVARRPMSRTLRQFRSGNYEVLVNRRGDVIAYVASGKSSATPRRRFTSPSLPKLGTGAPVFAFKAIRRPSSVPSRNCGPDGFCPRANTKRLGGRDTESVSCSSPGDRRSTTRGPSGIESDDAIGRVVRYKTPLTTRGVVSNAVWRWPRGPDTAGFSPV